MPVYPCPSLACAVLSCCQGRNGYGLWQLVMGALYRHSVARFTPASLTAAAAVAAAAIVAAVAAVAAVSAAAVAEVGVVGLATRLGIK